ncbi:hypothetical protein M408DRAFT_19078 [Serendipita vermifera MAFF 305830]|uniref:Uncharacterized protein n=1 Tax=Serendipita vermifera MAFF 305830 TaxID=933852 RepID=A0A0C3BPY4_SERVB|nr:hypothetical protein M408DRAFT_19078 [Serendipita vermifera MAFF 305830]
MRVSGQLLSSAKNTNYQHHRYPESTPNTEHIAKVDDDFGSTNFGENLRRICARNALREYIRSADPAESINALIELARLDEETQNAILERLETGS